MEDKDLHRKAQKALDDPDNTQSETWYCLVEDLIMEIESLEKELEAAGADSRYTNQD